MSFCILPSNEEERKREELQEKYWMLPKHAIKKRLLCLHVRAYVANTYQLCFKDVSNGKTGATKVAHIKRKR